MKSLWPVLLAALVAVLAMPGAAQPRPLGPLAPADQAWSSNYFSSPTGNIRCREFVKRNLMACLTLNDDFAVIVPLYGKARKQLNVGSWQFPRGPTLYYGERWRHAGRFRCRSSTDGMRCWSIPTGHGFFISRATYGLW